MTKTHKRDDEKNGIILIVDDDPLTLREYENKLNRDGHYVATAVNVEEALKQVVTETPDLILLDMLIPETDGMETIKRLKEDEKTKNIPVVFITNLDSEEGNEYIKEAKEYGALGYLIKPNEEPKKISEIVSNIIRGEN